MPSSVTHSYFCNDVYEKIDKSIKSKLSSSYDMMRIFAQGPDPYFFYDFHLTPRSRRVYWISNSMHHSKINEHFLSLIKYINDKNYYDNDMVLAYLYGQICHFSLDTTCHPYIVYSSGRYYKKEKSTYKYNGKHEDMEYFIDRYLIWKREQILPKKYKMYKELFKIKPFNNELKDVIDNVMKNVYGYDNVSKIYYKSIKNMKKFYYVFNYDRYGIKKIFYTIMDFFGGNLFVKKREMSFYNSYNDKLYYLNNDKNEWNHPTNKEEIYNYSFTELYIKAINKAVNIISSVDKMLKDKKIDKEEVYKLFGNLDYGTGKDCNLELDSIYFKY